MISDQVRLIGAPFHLGQPYEGVQYAPNVIRNEGLSDALFCWRGLRVKDVGDIPKNRYQNNFSPFEQLIRFCQRLSLQTYAGTLRGEFCLTLGGDHSIALGSIAGILRAHPDLAVAWVDAHGDINTPESSVTGNLHGTPLAGLLGQFSFEDNKKLKFLKNKLRPERLALVGVRDLDPPEQDIIEKLGILTYSAKEVKRLGSEQVMHNVIKKIAPKDNPIHLSFDIDSIDPSFAPSTGCLVNEGLSRSEAIQLCRLLSESKQLISMDLVEFNPEIFQSPHCVERTLKLIYEVLLAALPHSIQLHRFIAAHEHKSSHFK